MISENEIKYFSKKECFISDPDHLINILAANTHITRIVLLFLFLLYTVWPQIKYTQMSWKHIIIIHVALYKTILYENLQTNQSNKWATL